MANVIKKVKIMQPNGTLSSPIPIGANASDIKLSNGTTVQNNITNLNNEPKILSGTTAPTNSQGKNGDIYILYS